jgi:hypothetical protein
MNDKRSKGWDWRAELGRHEGRAANEAFDDQMSVIRFVGKLLWLPISLPLYLVRVVRRRNQMLQFVRERSLDRNVSDEFVAEITLLWVEAHPHQYPLGEYDPRIRRLQRTFGAMMRRQD